MGVGRGVGRGDPRNSSFGIVTSWCFTLFRILFHSLEVHGAKSVKSTVSPIYIPASNP